MLSALPGLRELRSTLAGGYLWLVFAWLCIDPIVFDDEVHNSVFRSAERLGDVIGPVGLAAAASLAAYLVGSLVDELRGLISRLYLRTRQSTREALLKQGRSRTRRRLADLDEQRRSLNQSLEGLLRWRSQYGSPRPPMEKGYHAGIETRSHSVLSTRLRRALANLASSLGAFSKGVTVVLEQFGVVLLRSLRLIAQSLALPLSAFGNLGKLAEDLTVVALRFLTAQRPEPFRAYVSPNGVKAIEKGIAENDVGASTEQSSSSPKVADIIGDFPTLRSRLLVDHIDLVGEIDRLEAEAEFRLAIVPPLAALAGLLTFKTSIAWAVAIPLLIPLLSKARHRRREAGDLIADSFAEGLVDAPVIQSYGAEPRPNKAHPDEPGSDS